MFASDPGRLVDLLPFSSVWATEEPMRQYLQGKPDLGFDVKSLFGSGHCVGLSLVISGCLLASDMELNQQILRGNEKLKRCFEQKKFDRDADIEKYIEMVILYHKDHLDYVGPVVAVGNFDSDDFKLICKELNPGDSFILGSNFFEEKKETHAVCLTRVDEKKYCLIDSADRIKEGIVIYTENVEKIAQWVKASLGVDNQLTSIHHRPAAFGKAALKKVILEGEVIREKTISILEIVKKKSEPSDFYKALIKVCMRLNAPLILILSGIEPPVSLSKEKTGIDLSSLLDFEEKSKKSNIITIGDLSIQTIKIAGYYAMSGIWVGRITIEFFWQGKSILKEEMFLNERKGNDNQAFFDKIYDTFFTREFLACLILLKSQLMNESQKKEKKEEVKEIKLPISKDKINRLPKLNMMQLFECKGDLNVKLGNLHIGARRKEEERIEITCCDIRDTTLETNAIICRGEALERLLKAKNDADFFERLEDVLSDNLVILLLMKESFIQEIEQQRRKAFFNLLETGMQESKAVIRKEPKNNKIITEFKAFFKKEDMVEYIKQISDDKTAFQLLREVFDQKSPIGHMMWEKRGNDLFGSNPDITRGTLKTLIDEAIRRLKRIASDDARRALLIELGNDKVINVIKKEIPDISVIQKEIPALYP
jgi:hypothetical protein